MHGVIPCRPLPGLAFRLVFALSLHHRGRGHTFFSFWTDLKTFFSFDSVHIFGWFGYDRVIFSRVYERGIRLIRPN
jgi:hypothetical protein